MTEDPYTAETLPTAPRADENSIPTLLKQLRDDSTSLVKQEVALFKTEMGEKAARVARNGAAVAVGGFIALLGLIFVLQAISSLVTVGLVAAGLDPAVALWLGPLIVGLIVAIVGIVMAQSGLKTIKQESLKPQQTIDSLNQDKKWIQQKAK